jgi:hypothetical protein
MSRFHEILGIHPGATQEEVKKAHLEMVKVWHPDRFAHDAELQKKAQQMLQDINHAFDELSKTPAPGRQEAPSAAPVNTHFSPESSSRSGGPWVILIVLAIIVAPLAYVGIHSIVTNRTINPNLISQGADVLMERGVMYRYSLKLAKEIYIFEGPRVPVDWEIDALLAAYNSHKPKVKQTIGNFTISQSLKPGDKKLIPLRYRANVT